MVEMRLLVANDPRAYREALSATFTVLRPEIEVFTAKSGSLDREYRRLQPELVLCHRLTRLIEREAPAWILLYPKESSLTVTYLRGERNTVSNMDLDKLLAIIDEALPVHH